MTQEEINAEIWRLLTPLAGERDIQAVFHLPEPGEDEGGVERYASDGDPPLELAFLPPQPGATTFKVRITRIGTSRAVEDLPSRPVPESDGLPDEIWVPDDPFRADYDKYLPHTACHYGLYTAIAQELKPTSILEIGVRGGYSAWMMLRAVPDALYLGIDLNQGTFGGIIGYCRQAFDMLTAAYPNAEISVLEGDSHAATSLPRTFDLVHIDGGHSHDDVLQDLELCLPYACHIIVDDVGFASTVRSGVAEFLDRHPDVTAVRYDSWRGLVVIDARGAKEHLKATPDLPAFFEAPKNVQEARDLILQPESGLTTEGRWREETPWLLERLIFPRGLLIDIGCGVGRLSGPLSRRPDHTVLGVDISAAMRRMAVDEVNNPERFAVTTLQVLARLVAAGLRAQGALAIWVLQHVPADELPGLAALLWQALEPGAFLFTLDRWRAIPTTNGKSSWWGKDRCDVEDLLDRAGFQLKSSEEPPPNACGDRAALRCWIRRRDPPTP